MRPTESDIEVDRANNYVISVITITDSLSEILPETWLSLQDQTCRDFEWIISYEAPANPSAEEAFGRGTSIAEKIRFVPSSRRKGPGAVKNAAIILAKGEFIFFLSSDGALDAYAIEKALLTLELNPQFDFVNFYGRGLNDPEASWRGGFHDAEKFFSENRNLPCFMARAGVFEKLLYNESLKKGYDDWEFWLHAAASGLWGYTIPEFLFFQKNIDRKTNVRISTPPFPAEKTATLLKNKYRPILNLNGFPARHLSSYSFGPVSNEPVRPIVSRDGHHSPGTILFVFPWLEIGGADKFNLDLAKGLKDLGWSIVIACTLQSENPWLDEFKKITTDIFLLPQYTGESRFHRAIAYLIRSRSIDLIFISHSVYGYYLLPYLRQYFPALPTADYLHNEEPGWYNGGYPMMSTSFDKLLGRTFVSSGYLKDWCVQRGKDKTSTDVVYTNIDTDAVKRNVTGRLALRKQLRLDPDTTVILYVARLTAQKQPDVLIRTIDKLYTKNKDFLCIIIGSGPDQEFVQRAIDRSPASKNILYLGALPNGEVKKYMDAADVFFLPSAFEGIALSIYEAMSKSLAIVGASVGGQEELVTADCGTLIARSTAEKESEAYCNILLDHISDPAQTRRMGEAGRQRVERSFNIHLMINAIDSSLRTLQKGAEPIERSSVDEYMILLNRVMMLSSENGELAQIVRSPLRNLLANHPRQFRIAKKIYRKFNRLRGKE